MTTEVEAPDYAQLADDCEALFPDTLNDWILVAQYAEDAVAATTFALRCAASGDFRDATLSADRVFEPIDAIVQYELEADEAEFNAGGPYAEHRLVRAEETASSSRHRGSSQRRRCRQGSRCRAAAAESRRY